VHLSIFIVLLTVLLSIFIVLLTVHLSIFIVLLTVHLSIFISVINQLYAQNLSFISCLYMFQAHVLIIRRSKLHYTASGVIKPIGVMIPEAVQCNFDLLMMSTCARNMQKHEIKLIVKQILCIKLVK
jgi:hypothetical protein